MTTDRPLRFCMMTTFYPPFHFGGDAIQVQRLCLALARRGHEVHVIHCSDAYRLEGKAPGEAFERHHNLTVHTLSSRLGAISPLITQQTGHPGLKSGAIRKIVQNGNFDVIHYHNMSLIGPVAMKWGDAIKLYTLHEHWLVCPMHILWRNNREVCTRRTCFSCQLKGGVPPQLWRRTQLLRNSLRHVDRFIAPSRFVAEEHRRQGLTLPATVIPHFIPSVDVEREIPLDESSRSYFLFAGRVEMFKGVEFLVQAFRRFTQAEIWIAGDGRDMARMSEIVSGCDRIRLLGKLSPSELAPVFRRARAVIVPSLCYETFGLSAVEALAHGVPVIVHRLGGLREIEQECAAVRGYETEDEFMSALAELTEMNSSRRAELGRQARAAVANRWSEDTHLAAYFDLIGSSTRINSQASSGVGSER